MEDESDVLRDCDRRTDEHFPMLDLMEEKTPRPVPGEVGRRVIQMPDGSSNRRRRVRENVRAKKVRPVSGDEGLSSPREAGFGIGDSAHHNNSGKC